MTAGVLSWNWQGLVINPSVPCMVSPQLRAGWMVPTVKFRLKQKALAGKAYTHGPRRSFPDTSAVVMSEREEWVSRASPLKLQSRSACQAPHWCKTAQKWDVPVEGAALPLVQFPQKQTLRKGLTLFIWEAVSGNPIRDWGSETRMGKRPIGMCCPKGYDSRPPEHVPLGTPAKHRGALSSPSATG